MTPPQDSVSDVERVARIIDPHAFKSWQSMYDYCIREGDSEAEARDTAEACSDGRLGIAREKAGDIIAALAVPINKIGEDAKRPEPQAWGDIECSGCTLPRRDCECN